MVPRLFSLFCLVLPLGTSLCGPYGPGGPRPRPAAPGEVAQESAWRNLAAAENAFARRAGEVGISPAFLEVLHENGMVFSPGPVRGRVVHTERPAPPDASLRWHPRVASASRAGDLGYTSGPWVWRQGDQEPASGHYVSVWSRRPDGGWSLLMDIGVSHPPMEDQEVPRPAVEFPGLDENPPSWTDEEAERELMERRDLLRGILASEAAVSLTGLALPDVRVYAIGQSPREGVSALVELSSPTRSWSVDGSGMAASRDLAYAWGTLSTAEGPESGTFLEIWVSRKGEWRLALLLLREA